MLSRMDVVLPNEGNEKLNYNTGALLYGYMMEQIGEYAQALHEQGIKPYSQYLFFDKAQNSYVWRINTMTESAYERLLLPLKDALKKDIFIKNKEMNIAYEKMVDYKQISNDELLKKYYLSDTTAKYITLKFVTPCSFHSFGEHVFVPDIRLIMKSFMSKADAFTEVSFQDEETLQSLVQNIRLSEYSIKSTVYYLSRVKIKSFVGTVTFVVNGPDMLKRLAGMLFGYGEYSGVGVKSTQGMGGIQIL